MDQNEIIKCDVCGATSDEKIIQYVKRADMFLCSKHKKQIYAYGKITDPTSRTTHDKNEYILHDDYAEMVLRDRENNIIAYSLIDLEDVEKCKQQKWSVNRSDPEHGYVRAKNTKINVSLQRYILDYDGPLDVDHINRNRLDNRKCNLRIVSRTVNASNNGDKGIYQQADGKWKVKVCRYSTNYYSYGIGFDTREEAIAYRDEILKYVEEHSEELQKEFDDARAGRSVGVTLLPSGKWRATYYKNGMKFREGCFDTKEEATNHRAAMMGGVPNVS